MQNSLNSVRIFSFQGRAILRDVGQMLGSKRRKKQTKKTFCPFYLRFRLACALILAGMSPVAEASGREEPSRR